MAEDKVDGAGEGTAVVTRSRAGSLAEPAGLPEATVKFPAGFMWGASTAAFQIEGATTVDGRTDCIWDAFCRKPGAVFGGDTGEPAADHYRRFGEDVELVRRIGLGAYRFSIA